MAKHLRVLFVIDKLEVGGTERQLVELARRLSPIKFELFLCCLSGDRSIHKEYFQESMKIKTLLLNVHSTYSVASILALLRLLRFIRTEKIDIIQGYFLKARLLAVLAGKLAGIKTIACVRDIGLGINFLNLLPINLANHCTDRFLVNSECVKQYLIENQAIQSAKIDVLKNGIDLCIFRPPTLEQKREIKIKMNIKPLYVVIGIIANLRPVKGLSDFIHAAALVHKSNKNTHFVIVGEGPQRNALQEEAVMRGVADYITFVGSCNDTTPYLSTFDIGVLCSYSEGFSNAILEYMATGLPVIATQVGGNKEQVQNEITGLLVRPHDPQALAASMTTLVQDQTKRERLGRNGYKYCAENHNINKLISRQTQYYYSLIENGNHHAG